MKISRVRIENFCCLHQVDIAFEEITSFIGPTGVGKSTVLRALDWFFNGEKEVGLSTDDVHSAADGERITVEVEFDGITSHDREVLGRYAPEGAETVSIWRTWEYGADKITGKALAYAPFEEVRRHTKAMDKRRAYNALRECDPGLGLPTVGSADAVDEAMRTWELANRDKLTESQVDDTHFFGFAGQSQLAKLIDFVFISADLRAYEEADDRKATAIGRILDHAVDRSQANEHLGEIEENAHQARQDVHTKVYGPMLDDISAALSNEVAKFTTGRQVVVTPVVQAPKPSRTMFQVSIRDGAAETSVYRQGHGFQRALIIAALKLLAERRRPQGGTRTLCLAIEEPELFQHPPQARTFAEVLRSLVASSSQGRTQVMYATHNPVFIDPRNYHQIRRLSREGGEEHPVTRVLQVSEIELCQSLSGLVKEESVQRYAGARCSGPLAEGFFSHAVVLVEGFTEEAVLLGSAERQRISLGAQGISVINAEGKDNILLCHAILTALGVPCYVVFDGDAEMEERKRESVRNMAQEDRHKKELEFERQAGKNAEKNADLLGYLGASVNPWPPTVAEATYAVFHDNLETYLGAKWPAWSQRRQELIASGDGFAKKDSSTYREATVTAASEPPFHLLAILENVQKLVR
ncbi:ATP-dependent nuclease [Streptantibioticus ferralitis]|uniref:AAA family ATPase n=1 Tax=Streptantibioticus ferralitis TaxID=236510 RepID=A0ABT5Z3M2_9ACTN|nr:AAA family ATPase [Streptantibioticus ferralitis]MDF2258432.1 AAA family ATPase [Streptantibioticus ferralitis]